MLIILLKNNIYIYIYIYIIKKKYIKYKLIINNINIFFLKNIKLLKKIKNIYFYIKNIKNIIINNFINLFFLIKIFYKILNIKFILKII
ncbi:MAG: hypothetical protein ABUS76_00105 [Candidatus Shikimatogenerans sp. Ttur]|uniref:Uncharacterized protein n=1 Tax=Candidatus Shikimatogenerans sp. Ttur TaxID=3158569 RepID=A0AAU7ZXQ2_9FLAO